MARAKPPPARGLPFIEAILAHLAGPDSPVDGRAPLDDAALAHAEHIAGVALSPAMHALLSYDASWVSRELGWFDDGGALQALPVLDVIAPHAGAWAEAYAPLVAARFPGKALPLDDASDSMTFLYLGDPDAHGEYPVIFLDWDTMPLLGAEWPGFDAYLAFRLDLVKEKAFADEVKATNKRLFGRTRDLEIDTDLGRRPRPVAGPAPGSVRHARVAVPAAPKQARLTDRKLAEALVRTVRTGTPRRLAELLADAKDRGLPASALDEAMASPPRWGTSTPPAPCSTRARARMRAGSPPGPR
jgi:hypothetical protein